MQLQKPRKKYPERISLSHRSVEKVNKLLSELTLRQKGLKITKKDFVDWLIENFPQKISSRDEKDLVARFYDEEKFVLQMLKDIKEAKKNGEGISASQILAGYQKSTRKRKQKSTITKKDSALIGTSSEDKISTDTDKKKNDSVHLIDSKE